jgi:hypothetical protein
MFKARHEYAEECFGTHAANQLRALFNGTLDPLSFDRVRAMAARCYNPMRKYELQMEACDCILDGFGIEVVRNPESCTKFWFSYVNMGDSYASTIVYHHESDVFEVSTWADVLGEYEDDKGKED